jgi:hypothetical protein
MSEESGRAGLGKVVYSVDETNETDEEREADRATKLGKKSEVQEADEESFPASDPPGFAGGSATEST